MIEHDLLCELKSLLDGEFAHTGFRKYPPTPELVVPPAVHLYALPAKRAQVRGAQQPAPPAQSQDGIRDEFPFIVIRPVSGEDSVVDAYDARGTTVDVWFICGIFTAGDEADGARDLATLMGRVRRLLIRNRMILSRWERTLPITWEVGDGADHAQPHPYHGGSVRLKFQAATVAETTELEEEVRVYGQLEG